MAAKGEKDFSGLKAIIVTLLFLVVFFVIIGRLNGERKEERSKELKAEIEQLMSYDMYGNYPRTPRDVAKLHNRYFELFYGNALSEEELTTLNQKVRWLYSSEILMYNSEDTNLQMLKDNIAAVNEAGYEYRSCELPEASQVVYYTQDGVEMATLEVKIVFGVEKGMEYMYMKYVMVKENDQWKIHVWGRSETMDAE
ncbi:MAG: hypothetical protein IKL53_10380 [Lachnospiraceae bacterium]|nr:hypothetical protein [Lachnospiraceae bacterium]